jgi:hypothetical protein
MVKFGPVFSLRVCGDSVFVLVRSLADMQPVLCSYYIGNLCDM